MEMKQGYKQTDVGVLPEEWHVRKLDSVVTFFNGKAHENCISDAGDYIVVNSKFISTEGSVAKYSIEKYCQLLKNDVAIVMSDIPNGKALAKCFIIEKEDTYTLNQRIGGLRTLGNNPKFLYYQLNRNKYFLSFDSGSGQTNLRKQEVLDCPVILPSLPEQTAIANALSDMDALISQTEKLIEKKKAIKQGAMQELLKPKDGWVTKKLGDVCEILDRLRKPLNDAERQKMKGDIPYCGANGIVGSVNDFIIDDDIILMAEDGGYFDEYKTRPIAYQMKGKCWVNNHAHILKSKKEFNQDFIFYSIVHKNILDYINGGTRAKLNKGEMINISISIPQNIAEQKNIATVFVDLSKEVATLETKLTKLKQQKQGMMQALLTGKIRLI